jgi:hypothetical protein
MPAGIVRGFTGGMIMDYVRNKRFFSPGLVKLAYIGFTIGWIIFASGFITILVQDACDPRVSTFGQSVAKNIGAIVVGLVLAVGGRVWLGILVKRRSNDIKIGEQVQEEVKAMHQKALDKHGVTEETVQRSAPLVFGGYILDENTTAKLFDKGFVVRTVGSDGTGVNAAIGPAVVLRSVMSASVIPVDDISSVKHVRARDGMVLSSLAEYTIFLFSEEKVFVYTRQFSLVDSQIKESAQVYSYRDIVSVSSETSKYGSYTFIVKVSGGTTLEVPSSSSAVGDIKGSVTAFMQLVREKKGA